MMNALARDMRFAVRSLRKQPGFSAIVVLTLGLGIGANTAIFSLLDQVLLRRLPVRDPQQLVLLDGPGAFQGRTYNRQTFSYPMYRDFRDRTEVFSGVIGRMPTALTLTFQGEAERVNGELVTGNLFDVLGVRPALGRVLSASDDGAPGAHPVVVLSYGYWMRRFGGDSSVLNQTLSLNGHPMTIVGVSARGFEGVQIGAPPDVMVPVTMKAQMTPTWDDLENRRSRWLTVMARLGPGVTRERAESQMNVVYRQILEAEAAEFPASTSQAFRQRFLTKHLDVLPGGRGLSDLRRQFNTPLIVLMCMVGVVLLIACANIANLLLARAASRQREVSIRLALGAGRARIVRQQLAESLVLAVAGAAVGLIFATWTGALLLAALPGDAADRGLHSGPDARVVAFALALAIVTALVFSIVPSLHATRASVIGALKEEAGSVAGGGRQARVRSVLVVAQVALSMVLLAGAALFARSLFNLKSVDPGFAVDHLVAFSIDPSLSGYDLPRSVTMFERMQTDLTSVPGVRAVSMAELGPLTGNDWSMTIKVDGYAAKENEDMNPNVDGVGPGYFSTMGMPLVAGREFTPADDARAPRVAVVNETLARYYFGTSNPIGRRFGFGRDKGTEVEIVGVVKDTRTQDLRKEPVRFIYIPYTQDSSLGSLTFYVRAAGNTSPGASIREAVRRIDPSLPMYDMKSMDTQVDESLFIDRMVAALSVAFGALATVLAAIGLYGVISFAVARRTREIGIRMALGAERRRVLWLVLREAAVLAGAGIAVGVAVALVVVRYVQAQLYGLSATDPRTLAAAAVVLGAVALLAGYVPARRATVIDPMLALRTE
jgi:predicted permease